MAMFKILTLSLIISSVLFFSCNNNQQETQETIVVSINDITTLENELFNAEITTPDPAKAMRLGKLYIAYAEANPNDSVSPDFLYKAADISMNLSDPNLTIALFDKIITTYPNYKNVSTVAFLKAYVYENQLNNYGNAQKYYLEFLDKYPDSDFADDAVVSLNNLGKSPEELIKEFESKIDK